MSKKIKPKKVFGHLYFLEELTAEDAQQSLALRLNPIYNAYINSTSSSVEDQRHYILRCLEKDDDFYFKIIRQEDNQIVGLIALYDIVFGKTAEWGRWIAIESIAALESVVLIEKFAFMDLGLQRIYSRTVAENLPVVSFHDRHGAKRTGTLQSFFQINGKTFDAVEHTITKSFWERKEDRLSKVLTALRDLPSD